MDDWKHRVYEYLLFKVWVAVFVILSVFFLGMAFGVFWLQEVIKGNV